MSAFNSDASPVHLSGGGAQAWRAGGIVLKPGFDPVSANWEAGVSLKIKQEGFRVAKPVKSRTGEWCVEGWCAWEFLEGGHDKGRWPERVAANIAFHKALAGFPKPAHFDGRTSPWSVADRVAWGEEKVEFSEPFREPLARLFAILKPINLPSQLVHGDLGYENIIFQPGLAPAIIDFSPYWRPAGLSLGVATADALAWEGADASILKEVEHLPHFYQLFARAVITRLVVADRVFRAGRKDMVEDIAGYQPAMDIIFAGQMA